MLNWCFTVLIHALNIDKACVCSHQNCFLLPLVVRGNDALGLTLVMLQPYESSVTRPHKAVGFQCNIQVSKTNPADRVDLRAVIQHKMVHMCGVLHLSISFWYKSFNGGPFTWVALISGEW